MFDRTLEAKNDYFGLHVRAAREALGSEWQKASSSLPERAKYLHTDLLGTLTLLTYFGGLETNRTHLFVLSDLRQSTKELNLEKVDLIPVDETIERLKNAGRIPELRGAKVFLLGVDPIGTSAAYFASLKAFWLRYFEEAGARVVHFSVDRRIPEF